MLALVNWGGTFDSATGGTFQSDTDGTFHSDIPGTFESDMGGTFKVLQSKEELTKSETYTTPFWGWDVYANLLALEFRVSEKIAIGAIVGGISYGSAIYTNIDTDAKLTSNQFTFDFNNSSVQLRFYF